MGRECGAVRAHLVPEEYLEAPDASDRSEEEGTKVRLPVVEEGESPHGSPAVVHDGLERGEGDARVAESLPHEADRIQRREAVWEVANWRNKWLPAFVPEGSPFIGGFLDVALV